MVGQPAYIGQPIDGCSVPQAYSWKVRRCESMEVAALSFAQATTAAPRGTRAFDALGCAAELPKQHGFASIRKVGHWTDGSHSCGGAQGAFLPVGRALPRPAQRER